MEMEIAVGEWVGWGGVVDGEGVRGGEISRKTGEHIVSQHIRPELPS